MTRFVDLHLRTLDVANARAFYATVLGELAASLPMWPLHELARARGARPHWLGRIEVDDVETQATALVTRGGTRLGPTATGQDGRTFTVVRDPTGAIVGLVGPGATLPPLAATWCQLNTPDFARSVETYRATFGWELCDEPVADGPGTYRSFSWHAGEAPVGAYFDVSRRSDIHPHWLFFFPTQELERAIDAVRTNGGLVAGVFTMGSGRRVAVCDDPQGAAFAMSEGPQPAVLSADSEAR